MKRLNEESDVVNAQPIIVHHGSEQPRLFESKTPYHVYSMIPGRYLDTRTDHGDNGLSVHLWLKETMSVEEVEGRNWDTGNGLMRYMKTHVKTVMENEFPSKIAEEKIKVELSRYMPTRVGNFIFDRESVCTVQNLPNSKETDWSTWKSTLIKDEFPREVYVAFRSFKHLIDWATVMQRKQYSTNLEGFNFSRVKVMRTFEEATFIVVDLEHYCV